MDEKILVLILCVVSSFPEFLSVDVSVVTFVYFSCLTVGRGEPDRVLTPLGLSHYFSWSIILMLNV